MATEIDGVKIAFGDRRQPKALPLSHSRARWPGFKPESTVLPKGYQKRKGCLALPCDIQFDRDVPVKLRDGTTVYVDVYRPTDSTTKHPALVAWSPYGKQGGGGNQILDDFPFRMGVPLSELSELQKWEGPDPGYWVQYGYAVVNVDPRGAGKSEGNIYLMGSQEGRDGADVVEWVGDREWCSGKVALTGNSWLAASQWFIAAEKPEHLACIAPWEGFSDLYGELAAQGGVLSKPILEFILQIISINPGENSWENPVEMALRDKAFGKYHNDKRAKVENIDVPAYVVASWSNTLHTYGTFRAYQTLKSDKWLRVHDTQEWPDYYNHESRTDLHRFFDYYLKGIQNNWPSTPAVRLKIYDTSNVLPLTGTNLTASAFPLPNTTPLKLYFNACVGSQNELCQPYPPLGTSTYKTKNGGVSFDYTFTENTLLCGPVNMMLSVSLNGTTDSDIFISMEKILRNGGVGRQLVIPFKRAWQSWFVRAVRMLMPSLDTLVFYSGPKGQIRISRRVADEDLSLPGFPVQRMDEYRPAEEGEIMQVVPCITPIGMRFSKGEKLRVRISAVDYRKLVPIGPLNVEDIEEVNGKGSLTLHCGLKDGAGSYVSLPVVKEGLYA